MSRDRSKDPPKSAAELMAELRQDPRFIAREREQQEQKSRNMERYRLAARALIEELAGVGFQVETVRDLRMIGKPYPEAVPVLLRWLVRVSDSAVKEDIVRTLSVPWARIAGPVLVTEFERADDTTGTGLRWAIGSALEVLANEDIVQDMIRLAKNPAFGRAREMVVLGLGKVKGESVVDSLIDLLDDDEVIGNAVMALGRQRAVRARSKIEALSTHQNAWIRKEAKKAIARIDKGP